MSSKKAPITLIEKYQAIEKVGTEVPTTYLVKRTTGIDRFAIFGDLVLIGSNDSDYVELSEAREALEWCVNQLGGNVQWREV